MSEEKDNKEESILEKAKKTVSRKRSSSSSKLKVENEELREKADELQDKYLRLFAEFDNYKKRTMKEKIDL